MADYCRAGRRYRPFERRRLYNYSSFCHDIVTWQTTVVPEDDTGVLKDAAAVAGDQLVLTFERDAFIQLELFGLTSLKRKAVPVPGIGSIGGVSTDKKYVSFFFLGSVVFGWCMLDGTWLVG